MTGTELTEFDKYKNEVILPRLAEHAVKIEKQRGLRLKWAGIFFGICGIALLFWALTYWGDGAVIDVLSGDNIHYYWIIILFAFAGGIVALATGEAEERARGEVIDLLASFSGWRAEFRPNQNVLDSYKTGNTPVHQLLDAQISFRSHSDKVLNEVRYMIDNRLYKDDAELIEVTCEAKFTRPSSDTPEDEEENYFKGILLTCPLSTVSSRRLAVYPRSEIGFGKGNNTQSLSDYVEMPEVGLSEQYGEEFIAFSSAQERIDDTVFQHITSLLELAPPHTKVYGFAEDGKFVLAIDLEKRLFDADVMASDDVLDDLNEQVVRLIKWFEAL